MRDSFVFYRSFADAAKCLPDEQRLAVYDALCAYAIDGSEPEGDGIVMAIMSLIRPQVDANNSRYENGKKGGRPSNPETEEEPKTARKKPKQNQTETKPKPKQNQTETKPKPNVNVNDNVNVNVNDNANVNANENVNANANVLKDSCTEPEVSALADVEAIPLNDGSEWRPTFDELDEYERLYPAVDIRQEFRNMRGWSVSNPTRKKTLSGVRRFVASWLSKEQNTARAAPRPVQRSAFDVAMDIARQEGVVNDIW